MMDDVEVVTYVGDGGSDDISDDIVYAPPDFESNVWVPLAFADGRRARLLSRDALFVRRVSLDDAIREVANG